MINISAIMHQLNDLERRLANIVRLGVVDQVDYTLARVRVKYDEHNGKPVITGWLRWITERAGGDITWWAPEIGEQVKISSPGGDLSQGIVEPALYQNTIPAPANSADIHRTNYKDGSWTEYNRATHKLTITVNGGDVVLNATGNIDAAAGGNAIINAGGNVDIDAGGNATVDATAIILNGGLSGGVVCQTHVCSLTGAPHPQGSTTVSSGG